MIRKFTIRLRDRGIDLLKELFEKKQFSFEDFYKWFNESKIIKEKNSVHVKRKVQLLIDESIIQFNGEKRMYELTNDATVKAVKLVNSKTIRFGLIHYYEKKIFSSGYLYYFINPFDQKPFYNELQYLIGENLFQAKFWESLDNQYGQLISYIRAEEYYDKCVQAGVKITPHYSGFGTIKNVHEELKNRAYITSFKGYQMLKNHFKKCFDRQCRTCGKNIFNLVSEYVEKIKAEIRASKEYSAFMDYLKKLPLEKTIEDGEIKKMKAMIDDFIQFDKEQFGKTKKDTILSSLSTQLKLEIIEIVSFNRWRLKKIQEYRATHKDRRSYLSEIERMVKNYTNSIKKINQKLDPNPILEPIDLKIGEKIEINQKTFQNYNKSIRKIGREGEKRIYEGLIDEYRDHPNITPVWKNEEKEAGLPYDILLENTNGEDQYIEVKTTHTDQRSFVMSETEIDHAMKYSDNYKLYLVINIGAGADSYKVVIDNFKKTFGSELKTVSRRLTYE